MARKATSKSGAKSGGAKSTGTSVARTSSSGGGGSRSQEGMGDAFIKLLQSPLVAELVAVAATAALAALAEHGGDADAEAGLATFEVEGMLYGVLASGRGHGAIPLAFNALASAWTAREQCVLTLPSEHPITEAVSATSSSSQ